MKHKVMELRNVSVIRDGNRILGPIDLDIFQGESVAILGPNGSGKTTLSRILSGEVFPYFDEVDPHLFRIFGKERCSRFDLLRHIGVVSMDLQSLFSPGITVYEVVCSGLFSGLGIHPDRIVSDDIDSKVKSASKMMSIDDILDREVSKLSLGEMRRALIARAMVHEPDLLILDEPMTGLDIVMRSRFRSLLDTLIRNGVGLILITHDLSEIPSSVDRVVALKEGHILYDGSKKDVLTDDVMTELYGESIKVVEDNGAYQMILGGSRI